MHSWVLRSIAVLIVVAGATELVAESPAAQRPSPDARGNYVFRWTDASGAAREFSFAPGGKIAPSIDVQVQRAINGTYSYRYSIKNARSALQKVASCYVEVAMPAHVAGEPEGWERGQPSNFAPRAAWFKAGFVDGVPDGVMPGATAGEFVVESVNLPGVTEFTCRGNEAPSDLPDDLPEAIEEEISRLDFDPAHIIRSIGPVIERPDDPLPALVRRIVRNYRVAVASASLTNRERIVKTLDSVNASAPSEAELRLSLVRLSSLLDVPSTDPWTKSLVGGLKECVNYLRGRLTPSR